MKVRPFLLASLAAIVLICSAGIAVAYTTSMARSRALRQAYEAYLTVLLEAQVKRDESYLPEVAVDPRLEAAVRGVEASRTFTEIVGEEFADVQIVEVIQYSQVEAIVRLRYDYRAFSQDLNTGVRTYSPAGRWFWRMEKVVFTMHDGRWKVKEIQFIDWSG